MKRIFITIYIITSFILLGWIADGCHSTELQHASASFVQADKTASDCMVMKEYGNDILSTSSEGLHISRTNSNNSAQNNIRLRNSHSTKSSLNINPCHHMGRVSSIVKSTTNLSSQGNGYYLHSLCRLRI
ncbi:MAG: hypothetical protein IKV33_07415 [Alistipes sp.]|nr:hypothetical protein [Alistipes sp.]